MYIEELSSKRVAKHQSKSPFFTFQSKPRATMFQSAASRATDALFDPSVPSVPVHLGFGSSVGAPQPGGSLPGAYSSLTATVGDGSSSANERVNYHYLQNKHGFLVSDLMPESYVFMRTAEAEQHEYPLLSWGPMNYELKNNADLRQQYGRETTALKVIMNYRFAGLQIGKGNAPRNPQSAAYGSNAQAFTIMGSALGPNFFLGLESETPGVSPVRYRSKLYGVWRRYEFVTPLDAEFGPVVKKARFDKKKEEKQYYWQLDPYVSPNGDAPPSELYTGSTWAGTFMYFGIVHDDHQGIVASNDAHLDSHSALYLEERSMAWQEATARLPFIEVMLGLH
jgi:hypothetical protein